MAGGLKDYNLGYERTLAQIKDVLAANAHLYVGVQVSCVAHLKNGGWRNALCVIRGLPRELGPQPARQKQEYPEIKFLERVIPPGELPGILNELKSKQLSFDSENVEFGQHGISLGSYELLPSENDYSTLPGYFYEAGSDSIAISQEPLIDYRAPFFPSAYHAVHDWVNIRNFHQDRDSRMGAVLIFLPECRTRLSLLAISDGILKVGTPSASTAETLALKVVGSFREKGGGNRTISERLGDKPLEIPVLETLDSLELYLVGADNRIFDYHREGPFYSRGYRRLMAKDNAPDSNGLVVQRAIESGETETVEFKPYIELGNPKLKEVVETTVAFANTRGGAILLGVNDHCVVEGVEKEVGRIAMKTGKPIEEALKTYVGGLRQRVIGDLNRTLPLTFSEERADGHRVLVITVPEGPEKPYFQPQSKIVYIRRGANNVVANPETEIPALGRMDPGIAMGWR